MKTLIYILAGTLLISCATEKDKQPMTCDAYLIPFGYQFYSPILEANIERAAFYRAKVDQGIVLKLISESKKGIKSEKEERDDMRIKLVCRNSVILFNSIKNAIIGNDRFELKNLETLNKLVLEVEIKENRVKKL